jgi:leucine-zipper of insertion element IS481
MGISRKCVKKWIDRHDAEGESGLHGRSSRPPLVREGPALRSSSGSSSCGGVSACLGKASVTVSLLVSQSTMTFVVVKSICLFSITVSAVAATVLAALWVARKEGLLAAA